MRWKWVVGIVGAVLVVLLVVVYLIAASYDYNKLKPLIANAAREYTGRELTLGGDIALTIGFPPTLEVNDIAFQNASWGSQPQMAQLKKLQVKVSILPLISGNLTVNHLILIEPEFLLEKNKSGKSNLDFDAAKRAEPPKSEEKTTSADQTQFELQDVELKDGKITYKDHQTGQTETVTLASLELKAPLFGGEPDLIIQGSYNQIPFQLNGNIGSISKALKSKEKWPLKLEARAVKTKVSAEGSIQDLMAVRGIDLKLKVAGEDLGEFEKFTGEPFPVKGPFRLSGHVVSPSENMVQVSDLLVMLGDSQIEGTVKVTPAAKRPRIDATLTSKQLDLRPVLANGKAAGGTPKQSGEAGSKKDKVFPNTPLQLGALQGVDAQVKLTAARILTPHLAFDDLLVDLTLKEGNLNIKEFKAGGETGGKLAGNMQMAVRKADPTINLQLTIEQLDLGNMARQLGISDAVDGKLNLSMDLRGQGDSIAAIMGGLNGETKVLMSDGKINQRYADLIGGDLRASLTRLFNPLAEKQEFTRINCLVSHFEIKDGLAQSRVLVIDTNRMTVVGEGNINLKTEKLDLGVTPDPKEGLGADKVGTISVSLSEFTKPFRLKGTLAHPSLGIDPAKTVLTFGRTLGGIALFGPAGLATSLVSGKFGENHPCAQSLAALGDKEKAAEKKESGGIGSKIKNLLSKPKD